MYLSSRLQEQLNAVMALSFICSTCFTALAKRTATKALVTAKATIKLSLLIAKKLKKGLEQELNLCHLT